MKAIVLMGLALAVLYALATAIGKNKTQGRREQKRIAPPAERKPSRLSEALPEHIVLSEVGYQAFLSAGNDLSLQGRIKTRRVDFLILDQAGGVVAAIELDGSSHDQDETAADDHFKNQLFAAADVRLVRWRAETTPKGPEIRECVLGTA